MSAFVVSKHHIDVLVSAAIDLEMTATTEGWEQRVDFSNADAVGRMLWGENVRSVAFRYRLWFENQNEALTYQADVAAYRFHFYPMIRAGAAAKALVCFEYQSCECDDYEASPAARFVGQMSRRLLKKLPGYEADPWGIDDAEQAARLTIRPFPRAVIASDSRA